MNDDRSIFGTYWDGMAGGFCLGVSVAVILYVIWKVGEGIALGRL